MLHLWSVIKRWVLPLWRQFNSAAPLLLALGVLFALAAIWWMGPQWVWRDQHPLAELPMRVAASVVVLLIPTLVWTWWMSKRYRQWQRERVHAAAVEADPCLPYVEAQERALNRSLASLLDNMERRRSLYQLPWYVVLGEENVGKTSLITRSNQSFAVSQVTKAGSRSFNDEHLAYTVDWWIGNDAVLIDPPGEFITQPEADLKYGQDAEAAGITQRSGSKVRPVLPAGTHPRLWLHLLDWLGRNRSRRPLNGVVMVVDLSALLAQSPEQRQAVAIVLRSRLFELTRELGTRLPLYVVLSKFDLLEGFEEFFARLTRSACEEMLGFTFTLDAVDDFDAWLIELTTRFDRFVERLNGMVFDSLSEPRSQEERHRLMALVGQVSGLRPALVAFLSDMLGSDRFTTPALVRGVYFSSVHQQGTLSNAFVREAGLPHRLLPPIPEVKPIGGTAVYFAQQLFQRVIYPEAGLAGDNVKVTRSKRRLLFASSVVAGLGGALVVGSWQYYFDINRNKADAVLAKSREFKSRDIDTRVDVTGRNLLAPLDQIREAVSIYGDYRDAWPIVADMGLYQGRAIGPMVDAAYLNLLSKRFLPALAGGVFAAIEAAPSSTNEQLAALRVYRMIEDRENRRPALVETWMARKWQRAYPGQGAVQEDLMRHLAYAMKYADTELPQYRQQIADVQQQLRTIPLAQRVYMGMKQDAQERLSPPLNLRNEIGPAFDIVYRPLATASRSPAAVDDGITLAPLLTAKGFKDYFEANAGEVTDLALIDQWVLGERQRIEYSEEDRKALMARVRALYSEDYVDSWRRALNGFAVTNFRDLSHGVSVLAQVTGPAAPMRRLLETLRDNTVIYPPGSPSKEPVLADAADTPDDSAAQHQGVAIRRAFAGLSDLLTAKGEQPSYYDETLRAVSAVYDYAKAVQDQPDRGKAALKAVLNRFSLSGPDPIATLQRIATGLPEPLNQQVEHLAGQTSQVLVIEALRELEKRWDADIYSFYQQRLAGRYPFTPTSTADASLEDFEAFFGPQGRLQQFQDQYLNVFLKDNLDALYSSTQGDYLVRTDVLTQLEKAQRIRDTFFNNRGALSVQLTVEPLALSGNRLSSLLSVDGQLIPYNHGPSQSIGLIWPNVLGNAGGSQLTLVNSVGNTSSLGYRGPWSLFRLLSRGHLNGRTDTSVDLSFVYGDGMMRYRVSADKANNPITQRIFDGFVLPRTLLQDRLNSARVVSSK